MEIERRSSVVGVENLAASYDNGSVTIDFDVVLTPAPAGAVTLAYQINATEQLMADSLEIAPGKTAHKQLHLNLHTKKNDGLTLLLTGVTGNASLSGEKSFRFTPADITPKLQAVKIPKPIARHRIMMSASPSELGQVRVVTPPAVDTTVANASAAVSVVPVDEIENLFDERFIKLDAEGKPLHDQTVDYTTTPWACVLDNSSGLVWEMKSHDAGLHDREWTYTWYNSDALTDGGKPGTAAKGKCGNTVAGGCDTEKFVTAVNATGLCGAHDWRLPTQEELQSIADLTRAKPSIDSDYFPNTRSSWYWSSSPVASDKAYAWLIGFYYGYDVWGRKDFTFHARLVRTERKATTSIVRSSH